MTPNSSAGGHRDHLGGATNEPSALAQRPGRLRSAAGSSAAASAAQDARCATWRSYLHRPENPGRSPTTGHEPRALATHRTSHHAQSRLNSLDTQVFGTGTSSSTTKSSTIARGSSSPPTRRGGSSSRSPLADRARTIRIPVHIVEQLNKIGRAERKLVTQLGREATAEEIAALTGIEPEEATTIRQLARAPISLEKPVGDEDESEFGQLIADNQAESPYERAVEALTKEALLDALENLSVPRTARARAALRPRWRASSDARSASSSVQRHARADPPNREPVAEEAPARPRSPTAARRNPRFERSTPPADPANRDLTDHVYRPTSPWAMRQRSPAPGLRPSQ